MLPYFPTRNYFFGDGISDQMRPNKTPGRAIAGAAGLRPGPEAMRCSGPRALS